MNSKWKYLLIAVGVSLAAAVSLGVAVHRSHSKSSIAAPAQTHRVDASASKSAKPCLSPGVQTDTEGCIHSDVKPKSVYCVREGGFPNGDAKESDYPECIWVDRLEQVPPGKPCMPSGCNPADVKGTLYYWCYEGSTGDAPPKSAPLPKECMRGRTEQP